MSRDLWLKQLRIAGADIRSVEDALTDDVPLDGLQHAGSALLRAERSGTGNGRVYHIHFTASDLEGSVAGVVTVSVPHKKKSTAVDGGELYDSTN